MLEFFDGSRKYASGWIGFYWGQTPDELRRSKELGAALTLAWLEFLQKKGKEMGMESWVTVFVWVIYHRLQSFLAARQPP